MTKQKPIDRGAGVLLPVFSLPSPYGIGTAGKDARRFIDFLSSAGQKYWQVLPLGPTGYGNSPYQSFSAFAANPHLIDLEDLREKGFLTHAELMSCSWGDHPSRVDYDRLAQTRTKALKTAFARGKTEFYKNSEEFLQKEAHWLEDFALFMALKSRYGKKPLQKWPKNLRLRDDAVLKQAKKELQQECDFYKFTQWLFFAQWKALKTYAGEKKIKIIGDLPLYVAADSSDLWANKELFMLDEKGAPKRVAGVPPDRFSQTGQLWGNPLYHWENMRQDGYSWWKRRLFAAADFYDIVRLDHFIGFSQFFSVKAKARSAKNGVWCPGPGADFFAEMAKADIPVQFVAEDLGVPVPQAKKIAMEFGYPEMKVLQFAFDQDEYNEHIPKLYKSNTAAYTGTHDNNTLKGFFTQPQNHQAAERARRYLQLAPNQEIVWPLIENLYESRADLIIVQMQDYLGVAGEGRINTPSTVGPKNWCWRMQWEQLEDTLETRMRELAVRYNRTETV